MGKFNTGEISTANTAFTNTTRIHHNYRANSSVFPLSAVVLLTPLVYEAQLLQSGNWDPAQSIVAYSAETRANYDFNHLGLMIQKALLVSPLVFHCVNGCRHIRWDQ